MPFLIYSIKQHILFTILFLLLFSSSDCAAESQTAQLQGLDKASVVRLLGSPTRSSGVPSGPNSNSSETLYYGDSQVSFINNRVTSIFDLGELKLALSKSKLDIDNNISWIPWPNPWTPPQSLIKELTGGR